MSNILILNGHPDPAGKGLCHAIAETYSAGARDAGHTVTRLDVARLDFGCLRTQAAFENEAPPTDIVRAQEAVRAATHLVMVFPLWMGDMPALLKAFLEQTLRPGFAYTPRPKGFPVAHLKGRSARVIVTMGMPAIVYRWYYRSHSLKSLERNILRFVGFGPVRDTIVGNLAGAPRGAIERRLRQIGELGRAAA
jgi:putative NADPH-quinone reductase